MEPTTLLMVGVGMLIVAIVTFFTTARFPKTKSVLIPLTFLFATAGILCNTASIFINLTRMYG